MAALSTSSTIVLIPARLASARLPDKPLAEIGGLPMIVQVWKRAMEADIGPVVVAAGDRAIADAITAHRGDAVGDRSESSIRQRSNYRRARTNRSRPPLPAGGQSSGRSSDHRSSTLEGRATATRHARHRHRDTCGRHQRSGRARRPQRGQGGDRIPADRRPCKRADRCTGLGRALYFTRATAPSGPGPVYHHIGIYAYQRTALERFATLQPSPLERRERLEQLRALEHGMTIGVARVDTVPLGVDTPEQLDEARRILG